LSVHCTKAGPRTLTLPAKHAAYNLLSGQWVTQEALQVRFHAGEGSTHVFLVGTREEIEAVLHRDPQDILRIDEIPARDPNVISNALTFDVPIMRLNEWMEGSDTDELADEWFLRPQQLIESGSEDDDAETPGSGRRRRRRKRESKPDSRDPYAGTPKTSVSSDDFEMAVMFRKRE
jgi:hypothetical protein